jgi:hypothetical protein
MKAREDEESEKLNFYYDHVLIAQGLSLVSGEVYVLLVTWVSQGLQNSWS